MKDIETEKKRGLVPSTFIESTSSIESIHSNASGSLKENDRLPITQSKLPFNFRFGEVKLFLENLVCEIDMNNSHGEIKRKRDIGQLLNEKYKKIKKDNPRANNSSHWKTCRY